MTAPIVKAEMLIRRPQADVFNAFVDPAITTKFWFTKSSGKLESGKRVRWEWEMYAVAGDIEVRLVEPHARIAYEWSFPQSNLVEWTFTPHALGTIVTITNRGLRGANVVAEALDATQGFNLVLCASKAWLEHGLDLRIVEDKAPDHNRAEWKGRP